MVQTAMPSHALWLCSPPENFEQRQAGNRNRHLSQLICDGQSPSLPDHIRNLPGWDHLSDVLNYNGEQRKSRHELCGCVLGLVIIETPWSHTPGGFENLNIQESLLASLEGSTATMTMIRVVEACKLVVPIALERRRKRCLLTQLPNDIVAQLSDTTDGGTVDDFLLRHEFHSRPNAAMQCWDPLIEVVLQSKWQTMVVANCAARSSGWELSDVWPKMLKTRKRVHSDGESEGDPAALPAAPDAAPPAAPDAAPKLVEDSASQERQDIATVLH